MSEQPLPSLLYAAHGAVRGSSVRHAASCAVFLAGAASGLLGCTSRSESQLLTSLNASGEMAFVCRNADTGEGTQLDECPDRTDDGIAHELLGLVTQTLTSEVAVLNLSQGKVLDVDPATPGPGFLPVGGSPTDVVVTPGGTASFVPVAGAGREGLFALPTRCIGAPRPGDARRELTAWAACSLPVAPGRLQIVTDPPNVDGMLRGSCSGEPVGEPAAAGSVCAADLRLEAAVEPQGRRVLAVTLPQLGELAFVDAQWLLDRTPGSFEPCRIERRLKLAVSLPPGGIDQLLPRELVATGCGQAATVHYDTSASAASDPAGMTQSMGRLYIADRSAPVVHVVNVTDPCAAQEEPPLLPVSFEYPTETVTTRDVSVSPTTARGKKFLYAIDDRDGSLMVFDLTAGAERTPLIRPEAARLPYDPADRIAFASPVRDVEFVARDMPLADANTGVAVIGQECDPLPGSDSPGTLYRPSTDYSTGARPRRLRGVFGMAALANGQISVIDIEDTDAPCRRPVEANPTDMPDQHGCFDDPDIEAFVTAGGKRTVTGEVTCKVIVPHTARSANLLLTSSETGVHAPALRTFPRLATPDGVLAIGRTEEGVRHPVMLAVPFTTPDGEPEPSGVNVGTMRYGTDKSADEQLVIDPAEAEQASLLLPTQQPRSYVSGETFAATFEGALFGQRTTGRVELDQNVFVDVDAGFCRRGVQDQTLAAEMAAEYGVAEDERTAFGELYSDYVQLTADFDEDDPYWDTTAGQACVGGSGRDGCEATFGTADEPTTARDLTVLEAFADHLMVQPRNVAGTSKRAARLEQIRCCFPSLTSYVVRGGRQWIFKGSVSGFRHTIVDGPNRRCVRECNGRKALFRGRALEISSSTSCETMDPRCAIGPANDSGADKTDFACVVAKTSGAVDPERDAIADACVFENMNARFAIYRGQAQSKRDMQFNWDVQGGFAALSMSIATTSSGSSILPQSIKYLSSNDRLVAVDGISAGVSLFDMDQLENVGNPYL